MRFLAILSVVVIAACLCGLGRAQEATPPPTAPAPTKEMSKKEGIPPRATPGEYQAHAQAGTVIVAAEFKGHFVPTKDGLLSSEDYVAVEAALFGPPETRLKLATGDFSLRLNGKKALLPGQSDVMVFKSVKDPEWEPAVKPEAQSKTSIGSGGRGGGQQDGPPVVPKPPIELQRAWAQHVEKASMMEGDRALPQAGLIFFRYAGKTKSLHSLELIYDGPAGKATLTLEPE